MLLKHKALAIRQQAFSPGKLVFKLPLSSRHKRGGRQWVWSRIINFVRLSNRSVSRQKQGSCYQHLNERILHAIFLLGEIKINAQVSGHVLYPAQSNSFTGNFRIWNKFFPKWELRGGMARAYN
jgi:hypothetical protein